MPPCALFLFFLKSILLYGCRCAVSVKTLGSEMFKFVAVCPIHRGHPMGTDTSSSGEDTEGAAMEQDGFCPCNPVEEGKGLTRVNVELPCLLPPRNFVFIFLQKRIIIIRIVWVPGGKLLLQLVYGLGSEKLAQAMGKAGEGDVLQHIPFRPGTCPTAGCPESINWKNFIILLRVSSRKNSQHAVPSGAPLPCL